MRKSTGISKEVRNQKTQEVIYKYDAEKKLIQYYIAKSSYQYDKLKEITFLGFTSLPSGFKTDGTGFTRGGSRMLFSLYNKLQSLFDLYIVKSGKSIIENKNGRFRVVINYIDFKTLKDHISKISSEKNKEMNEATSFYMNKFFPDVFDIPEVKVEDISLYKRDELSNLLEKQGIMENLTRKDTEKLQEFYSTMLHMKASGKPTKQKLFQLAENKSISEVIYIEKVLQQFEERLKKSHQESSWQAFLKDYILLFNSSYTKLLEKQSIALGGKYPDFILVDMYNYLDIYEIKTPQTNLLKFDSSRGNYYWDTEIGKAISQVENYIHTINETAPLLIKTIKDKYGMDIRVVKPRGFIIAGESSQLTEVKMKDDLRLLSGSLKNIDIILYDDFLNNMKNFMKKIDTKSNSQTQQAVEV